MWFDDASLLCLEEVGWKIGNDQGEFGVALCEQHVPETDGIDGSLYGTQAADKTAYERI